MEFYTRSAIEFNNPLAKIFFVWYNKEKQENKQIFRSICTVFG